MMNYAMFQRNGKSGYVLKPDVLRIKDKESFKKRTKHFLDITVRPFQLNAFQQVPPTRRILR